MCVCVYMCVCVCVCVLCSYCVTDPGYSFGITMCIQYFYLLLYCVPVSIRSCMHTCTYIHTYVYISVSFYLYLSIYIYPPIIYIYIYIYLYLYTHIATVLEILIARPSNTTAINTTAIVPWNQASNTTTIVSLNQESDSFTRLGITVSWSPPLV